MKKILSYIFLYTGISMLLVACYKDKGNYTYHIPPAPVVTNMDSVYSVLLNDTLTIAPTITINEAHPNLSYVWRVDVPAGDSSLYFYGPVMRMHFTLPPQTYHCRMTITDSTNGLKYFYDITINGLTAYSIGTFILSQENGISQLSYVSPAGVMTPRLYESINGTDLPANATQLIPLADTYILPGTISSYWVICSGGADPGVQVDANTFEPIKGLKENFFTPPSTLVPGTFEGNAFGVLLGVANGKLYTGSNQTWNLSPTYGMFGLGATGNYSLFHQAAFNATFPYFLGYDSVAQSVVAFTNFGSPSYIGTGYQVPDSTAFNPMNVKLSMLDFEQINDENCYGFGRAANDSIYEIEFGAAFMGIIQITPQYKRPFPRQDLITSQTLWGSSPGAVFYFSSGSTIYSYNPLNQNLQPLAANFNGKAITMIRMANNGNTLIAGVAGSVFFLDVSTGKNGNIVQEIDGVPGIPKDVTVRTE